jgi:guanine deaminase
VPQAYRASICHCLDDPGASGRPGAYEFLDDAVLVVDQGRILELVPAAHMANGLGAMPVTDLRGKILVPGLVDCHVHFAQVDIMASFGDQLLDWLEDYAYPAEQRMADTDRAAATAALFLDELLANGTTTACVFATVHPQSVDALFAAAEQRGMRLITGKVLMDRNCPPELRDTPASAYADSRSLYGRWHGRGRLGYAITPRFALTSTAAELSAAGRLARELPDAWMHTHLAENRAEVGAVAADFPDADGYLDVYARAGLLRKRAVFAHCLHLDDHERHRLAHGGGSAAFCPTSNLFLGSGLFDLAAMHAAGVPVGLATDVGAGTSLSLLRTMGEAYKVLQLKGQNLPASRALYLATLGAARALGLDDCIGNFLPGKEADFVVLDPQATRLTTHRDRASATLEERLFALFTLGDDRHVQSTWLLGRQIRARGKAGTALP